MPSDHRDLSPFSSHIIGRLPATPTAPESEVVVLLLHAMEVISDVVLQPRRVTNNDEVPGVLVTTELIEPWRSASGMQNVACLYTEHRPVTWLAASAAKDELHHLLVMTADASGLVLITATDASHRAALLAKLRKRSIDRALVSSDVC